MKNVCNTNYFSKLSFVFIAIIIFVLTGCNKEDDAVDVDPVAVAFVSLYHASPDGPPVDILMENRRINFYPLQYSSYTGYLNFFPGERNMRVRPSEAANVIIDTTFNFVEGEAYSLFYVNQLANIQALLVEDGQVVPEAGNAAIRFIHLSPDAPAVDFVRITEANGGGVMADSQAYLDVTEFMTIESGLQSFQVRGAGAETALLSIPDVNLLSGGVYTIVIRGFQAPPPGNTNNLQAQILINN